MQQALYNTLYVISTQQALYSVRYYTLTVRALPCGWVRPPVVYRGEHHHRGRGVQTQRCARRDLPLTPLPPLAAQRCWVAGAASQGTVFSSQSF